MRNLGILKTKDNIYLVIHDDVKDILEKEIETIKLSSVDFDNIRKRLKEMLAYMSYIYITIEKGKDIKIYDVRRDVKSVKGVPLSSDSAYSSLIGMISLVI